jgi:hypothetical protein
MMNLNDLKDSYNQLDRNLEFLSKQRKTDSDRLAKLEIEMNNAKTKKANTQKAEILLMSKATEIRDSAIDTIESIVTTGIKFIYGDDYRVQFDKHEEQREDGNKSGFKIGFQIVSETENGELVTGINDRGGGLAEVTSSLVRFAFLKMKNHDGFILLDESWSAVSADLKMQNLIEFIAHYVKENDLQLILNTHRAEMFGKIADNILRVQKNNGVAKVSKVTYETIQEEQLNLIDD